MYLISILAWSDLKLSNMNFHVTNKIFTLTFFFSSCRDEKKSSTYIFNDQEHSLLSEDVCWPLIASSLSDCFVCDSSVQLPFRLQPKWSNKSGEHSALFIIERCFNIVKSRISFQKKRRINYKLITVKSKLCVTQRLNYLSNLWKNCWKIK